MVKRSIFDNVRLSTEKKKFFLQLSQTDLQCQSHTFESTKSLVLYESHLRTLKYSLEHCVFALGLGLLNQTYFEWYEFDVNSPWSSWQCGALLEVKLGFVPQARHQNKIQKVFLCRFSFSRFLAKTLRENKIAMESFSKNLSFKIGFKLQLPALMYKIKTYKISCVRNQVRNPD